MKNSHKNYTHNGTWMYVIIRSYC